MRTYPQPFKCGLAVFHLANNGPALQSSYSRASRPVRPFTAPAGSRESMNNILSEKPSSPRAIDVFRPFQQPMTVGSPSLFSLAFTSFHMPPAAPRYSSRRDARTSRLTLKHSESVPMASDYLAQFSGPCYDIETGDKCEAAACHRSNDRISCTDSRPWLSPSH